MAGKTKKKSSKKPAAKKKAPVKKAAAGAKGAAKKAAAKKAAPKKAAPKKAAAKKAAAPKKKVAAKKPAAKKPAPAAEPIEVVEGAAPEADAAPKASLQTEILAMARQLYGDKTDEELLALDPNNIDAMDPSMFYELLGEKYGVEADPNNDYFGGFGGTIKHLISFVESRWDGTTRKDTPMPPGDWLEEYVHPES
jgi:hypothetical protein